MEVKKVKISDLKFAEYNPRKISKKQLEDLKESLEEFDWVEPIVVNQNKDRKNIIVGGHQRVKAFKALGGKEVPCTFVDLPLERERQLNIRLNKNTGEFDFEILLSEFTKDELTEWGFEDDELDFKLEDLLSDDETEGDDDIPDTPEPVTVKGDLYELGKHRLLCGDSTVITDVEKLMDGDEPYLMITDPPYGVEYDPSWRNDADRANGKKLGARAIGKVQNDENADWTEAWALSPSKTAYVYHDGKSSSIVQKSLEDCDYEIRSQIIWSKNNFAISRGDYHWKHEPCWYAVKKGFKSDYIGDRSQTTVWEIDKPQKSETGHGTQKPIECILKPINNHRGDIYDPFLGSGTSLIACEKTKRKCYGMEIDPKYCDVIVKRYVEFCEKNQREYSVKRNGDPCNDFG
jgi:DNA modification methylase